MPQGKGRSDLHGSDRLTDRQVEVTELLKDGLTGPQISEELGISIGTVRTHIGTARKTVQGAGQSWETLISGGSEQG